MSRHTKKCSHLIETGDFGKVKMGNQGISNIIGVGDIDMMTNSWCIHSLKDVRHVPEMRLNLISVGKLDDAGMISQFGGGRWKLTHGNLIMARGRKEGSLYVMPLMENMMLASQISVSITIISCIKVYWRLYLVSNNM